MNSTQDVNNRLLGKLAVWKMYACMRVLKHLPTVYFPYDWSIWSFGSDAFDYLMIETALTGAQEILYVMTTYRTCVEPPWDPFTNEDELRSDYA